MNDLIIRLDPPFPSILILPFPIGSINCRPGPPAEESSQFEVIGDSKEELNVAFWISWTGRIGNDYRGPEGQVNKTLWKK